MAKKLTKAELLALFETTRSVIDGFIGSRSDAQQIETGALDSMSARDVLAHAAFWMDYMVGRMGYFARGEQAPRGVDFGGLERGAFEKWNKRPWAEVVEYAHESLGKLAAEVGRFSDAQLSANNTYGDDDPGGPLWGEIRANGFIVPLEQIEKFCARAGETARAQEIRALLKAALGEPELIVVDLVEPSDLLAQQKSAAAPMVIDVRGPKEFAAGHIRGAVNIPLGDLPKKLKRIPANQPVVTYCNMHHPGQSRGEQAAALLRDEGYDVKAIAGGLTAWEAGGLPMEGTGKG